MADRAVHRKVVKGGPSHQPHDLPASRKPVGQPVAVNVFEVTTKRFETPPQAPTPAASVASLLGVSAANSIAMIKRVEAGLPFQTLEHFQRKTQLSTNDLAELVDIKLRTLRRRKDEGRLEPDESDRLLRASMIWAKALDLFEGDADGARRWFDTPAKALGGARPIEFARTELGMREVEALIDRIEDGVFS